MPLAIDAAAAAAAAANVAARSVALAVAVAVCVSYVVAVVVVVVADATPSGGSVTRAVCSAARKQAMIMRSPINIPGERITNVRQQW